VIEPGSPVSRALTHTIRRTLVGREQVWAFEPANRSRPSHLDSTSLYLHIPFCRNTCPYCPYTTVPYDESLVAPYSRAVLLEIDAWAEAVGPTRLTSVYIGGGTPTLAFDVVAAALDRIRSRFRLHGPVCIETGPGSLDGDVVARMLDSGIAQVSLGVQSFTEAHLRAIGRRYSPTTARADLQLLASAGFDSVNADLMFALPGQSSEDVLADLETARAGGADQLTCYPLFTFPYSEIGQHLRLSGVRLPSLRARRRQYAAIHDWCVTHDFQRVSVWGFAEDGAARYSSVTRDGYIGIGLGAGSHLPDGFTINTFDPDAYLERTASGALPWALRMPFSDAMSAWWWLYWRLYDTRVPLRSLAEMMGAEAPAARRLLRAARVLGFARIEGNELVLTEPGAFWMHLGQNHFALSYVATLWTHARQAPWPTAVQV
jgi:oxygen-independent coproporphyrinogen-3 oxidase